MTIIRFISRSIINLRPSLINFESCVRNQTQRNASILAVKPWKNEKICIKDHRAPTVCHSLEGQFVRNKFKKPKQQDDDHEDVSKRYIFCFHFQ